MLQGERGQGCCPAWCRAGRATPCLRPVWSRWLPPGRAGALPPAPARTERMRGHRGLSVQGGRSRLCLCFSSKLRVWFYAKTDNVQNFEVLARKRLALLRYFVE